MSTGGLRVILGTARIATGVSACPACRSAPRHASQISSAPREGAILPSTTTRSLHPSGNRRTLVTTTTGHESKSGNFETRDWDLDTSQRGAASSSSSAVAHTDLLEAYRSLVAQGRLQWDDEQVRCVMKLRSLLEELRDYSPPVDLWRRLGPTTISQAVDAVRERDQAGTLRSWWKGKGRDDGTGATTDLVKVLTGQEEIEALRTPKGIMLTGPPGTGKSFLLSLFFNLLPTRHKRRWHYHAFTLYLYHRVFQELEKVRRKSHQKTENMERAAKSGWRSVFAGGRWEDDPDTIGKLAQVQEETIPLIIARDMLLDYHILYFDELQLVDAPSAALIRDVLSWYWRLGGVIITCSNRVPDSLYHAGVQKERMSGFLDALKMRCEVVEVDGGKDFRRMDDASLIPQTRWHSSKAGFDKAFKEAHGDKTTGSEVLSVYGRKLSLRQAVGDTCRASFTDLCEQPLGPADYLSLASRFSTVFIEDVPVLLLKNKNEARRLINLIDALYESRCQVHILADTPLDELFFPDAVSSESTLKPGGTDGTFGDDSNESIMAAEALSETLHAAAHPNVSLYNPFERQAREKRERAEAKKAGAFGVLGIWTGEDERFAYKRAVSRLSEMTSSPAYFREKWIPLDRAFRTWETSTATQSTSPAQSPLATTILSNSDGNAQPRRPSPASPSAAGHPEDEDFATEAAYSRPHLLQPRAGEEGPGSKPVISEKHVWGVVDRWGPKAGRWGKGSRAFEDDQGLGR